MMTPAAALALALNEQVKFGKETMTVVGTVDMGSHLEPLLLSETGKKCHGTLFIAHLLSRPGDPVHTSSDEPEYEDNDAASESSSHELEGAEPISTIDGQPTVEASVLDLPEACQAVGTDTVIGKSEISGDEEELVKAYLANEEI